MLASGCSSPHHRSPRDRRAARHSSLICIASAALLPVARCSVFSSRLVLQCSFLAPPRSSASGSPLASASAGVVRLRQLKLGGPAAEAACRTTPPSLRPLPTLPAAVRVSARGTRERLYGAAPWPSRRVSAKAPPLRADSVRVALRLPRPESPAGGHRVITVLRVVRNRDRQTSPSRGESPDRIPVPLPGPTLAESYASPRVAG